MNFNPLCQIDFQNVGDRHGHRILMLADENLTAILESVEGNSDEPWPYSPPLQQIHQQELPAGPVIWGLGMAGSGHWSGSFTVSAYGGTKRLHAELALRSSAQPEFVGSTYRIFDPETQIESASPERVVLRTPRALLEIAADSSRAKIEVFGVSRRIAIVPALTWIAEKPTISWDYFLSAL